MADVLQVRGRWIVLGFALLTLAAYVALRLGYAPLVLQDGSLLLFGVGVAYLLWRANPTWTLSAAIVLTPFSGWWTQLGLPGGFVAPDRFLVIGGVVAIAFRGPWMRDRPALRMEPVHWALVAAAAVAGGSAVISGSAFDLKSALLLVEAFGLLPFLAFYFAPLAFQTEEQRRVLLVALVGLGLYLGIIALLETTGPKGLIWPSYINNPRLGIHPDKARGPFLEAVTNGMALFCCGTASVIAVIKWRSPAARALAAAVVVLCGAGILFALERSGWVAATAAVVVTGLLVREIRPYLIPAVLAGTLVVAGAFAFVPSLHQTADKRAKNRQTVWDRKNLARAATNMVEARPLFGFGWDEFRTDSKDYFVQADSYPLTAGDLEVHNVPLGYAANIGLVGVSLWALAVLMAIYGVITTRGSPDDRLWKIGFAAVAVYYVVVTSFVPPQVFPNLMFWLWAAVAWSPRVRVATARRDP